MPSSRTVGRISASGSRDQSEYSVCSAVIGWTACARLIVSGDASLNPEIAHLARVHELLHRADGLLDLHRLVDTVLVVEVDHVDAEALQGRVAGGTHVVGVAPDTPTLAVLAAHVAEFGGEL